MRLWFVVLALVSAGAIAEARTADKMPAFNVDKNCKAEAAGDALHEHAIASRARLHAWAGAHGTRAREEPPP